MERVVTLLKDELKTCMQLGGAQTTEQIDRTFIVRHGEQEVYAHTLTTSTTTTPHAQAPSHPPSRTHRQPLVPGAHGGGWRLTAGGDCCARCAPAAPVQDPALALEAGSIEAKAWHGDVPLADRLAAGCSTDNHEIGL